MKRLLTSAVLFLCCTATTFAQFSGSGNGTEDDPYLIYNETQLSQMVNFLNQEEVVFKLMKDMDLTTWISENNPSQGWLPIGVESSPFKGKFYGNNHTIRGLMISRSTANNVGFFGFIDGATIQDLILEGTIVTGINYVGGLVGYSQNSVISNVIVKLSGVSGTSYVGGVMGYSLQATNITGFNAEVDVNGTDFVGGIIGFAGNGTFQNGSFTGNVGATDGSAGGFAGKATTYQLIEMTSTGDITSRGDNCRVGGMVAMSDGIAGLTNCTYKGNATGTQMVGGIVGELIGGGSLNFTSCFSKGKITNTGDYTGGIVGVSNGACIASMESCSHFGDIIGKDHVGGLIGAMLSADVKPTLSTYTVYTGLANHLPAGTLLQTTHETIINGTAVTASINNCTAIGNIDGDSWLGGLIGSDLSSYGYMPNVKTATCSKDCWIYLFKDGVYTDRYTYSKITYTHSYARNSVSHSLTNNYYSGTIHGMNYVGGLVGLKGGGELKNNYAYANIYGDANVGGIVGSTTSQTTLSSYSMTTIKSNVANCQTISATTSDLGRIYGSIADDTYTTIGALGSAEGNRGLAQTKLILQGVVQDIEDNLQQGTSIGPSALRLKANYVSWGWDFDENWDILETECYPYKKYQAAPSVVESNLVSQATTISGKSLNGGTVYLYYKDRDAVFTVCDGHQWTFNTEALQSGALVQIYVDVEGMTPSYFTTATVGYPGNGTANDPWRIYTAEDLQGASNKGYYKLMNDIDLTSWINENSPIKGWIAVGRNSGEATYIDGGGHKVTGLWIEAPDENFTGLFSNFSAGQIKNLIVEVATGKKVRGADYTGILIGRNANGRLVNCSVTGDVEGTGHVGGIVGYVEATTLDVLTFDGKVTSNADNAYVGGMAGQMIGSMVTNCRSTATINTSGVENYVGGLAGYAKDGTISKSTTSTALEATGTGNYVGGLVGYSETPITLSASDGNASATGDDSYSGGLVGYALSPISNCYSTTNTTGTQFTAGLVGYTFSTIDKCYAKGDVNGVMYGGGLVGELDGQDASLTNSVACNNILSLSAQSSWGSRVIGGFKNGAAEPDQSNYALSTMQVSLNNVPQTKTDDAVEGIAKTKTELMQKATYQNLGWDFDNVWKIDEGTSYPYQTIKADTGTDPDDPGSDDPDDPDDPQGEVEVTDISTMDNVIYIEPMEELCGTQATISLKMKNSAAIRGFQFDLYLPQGVTVVKSSKNKIQGALSEGRLPEEDEHQLTFSEQPDGAIRFLCSSQYDETFTGNDGEIATLQVNIGEEMKDGDYAIDLKNVKLTETDISKYYLTDLVRSKLTVKTYILGDINNDNLIDVSDYTGVANHIHGNTPEGFNMRAADVDESGNIDVSDYTGIANIIHTGSIYGNSNPQGAPRMLKRANTNVDSYDNVIYITPFSAQAGEQVTVSLKMKNTADIRGFQFDLYLPEGMTVAKSNKGRIQGALSAGRLPDEDEHELTFSEQPDGAIRFLCSSQYDETFTGNDGELATLKVNIAEDIAAGDYPILLKNMKLTETDISKYYTAKLIESTLTITGTSGISLTPNPSPTGEGSYYTLDGQKLNGKPTQKGVYIQNGKKIIVK